MTNFQVRALTPVGLLSVALAFSLTNPRPASAQSSSQSSAQGSAPVTIVNPLPVPVKVEGEVGGTVNAVQSGAWNVGLTGLPVVRDLDSPARQAFQARANLLTTGRGGFTPVFTAPADRAVVIEFVSARCIVATGNYCSVGMQANQPVAIGSIFLDMKRDMTFPDAAIDEYVTNQQLKLTIAPGKRLDVFSSRNTTAPAGTYVYDTEITVFGYYVACSESTPCAPSIN